MLIIFKKTSLVILFSFANNFFWKYDLVVTVVVMITIAAKQVFNIFIINFYMIFDPIFIVFCFSSVSIFVTTNFTLSF